MAYESKFLIISDNNCNIQCLLNYFKNIILKFQWKIITFFKKQFIIVYIEHINKTLHKMDMHPYAGSEAQSLNFGDDDMHSQPSTYKVNVLAFKQLPRCISRQFSDFGDLSIDDSVHHQIAKPNITAYKCFKCFGRNKIQDKNGITHKCRQCSGSEYITEHHPLVAIMQQIIKKKMPHLSFKVEEQRKHENKRETLELQYGCKDVIKEQSFSYQQQSPPFCRNCNKQCDPSCYRICQKCPDFNICETCFQKRRFHHHHPLIVKDASRMPSKISQAPFNMRKISQQIDSDSQNYLDDLEFKCSNCHQAIDICYDACVTCQHNGIKYFICNTCSEYQSYSHDPSHVLVMRTVTQISELNRIQSANSAQNQNLELNSISYQSSKNQIKESVIRFNHNFINQSFESNQHMDSVFGKDSQVIPDEFKFNLSDHMYGQQSIKDKLSNSYHNDGQFQKITRKKLLERIHSIESSLNGIDLSSSLQIQKPNHLPEEPTSPLLSFVPIFNTITHDPIGSSLKTNPQEQYIFNDYQCDICGIQPIKNKRFHCTQCQNFDLCQQCYIIRSKRHQHRTFQQIDGRQLRRQRDSIIQLNQSKNLQNTHIRHKNGLDLRNTLR